MDVGKGLVTALGAVPLLGDADRRSAESLSAFISAYGAPRRLELPQTRVLSRSGGLPKTAGLIARTMGLRHSARRPGLSSKIVARRAS